jgi:hypothetical protein
VPSKAVSFDAPGARYDHRDGKCTFEVLIDEYDLGDDPALLAPGELASSFSGRTSAGSPGEASCFGNFPGQRGRDLAAEFIGVADWQIRVYPALDLDTQGSPGPPGAGVGVDDSGHRSGGCLGAGDHRRVDAIGQAVQPIACDCPKGRPRRGDREPDNRDRGRLPRDR